MRLKTVDRLILRSFLAPMMLAFAVVMFVFLLNFLWKYIEELVGKGLGFDVIAELLGYILITLIPAVLPLAILMAANMTMGGLGENYELQAMKSAGMSLTRILRSMLIVISIIAAGSFFVSNNLVPYAWQQSRALLFDVQRQKQAIEFKDGIFFNGIDGMNIRVEHQCPDDKLLTGILIYNNTDPNRTGVMQTTLADSGYIKLSDDKMNLLVTLYGGVMYEQTRNARNDEWYDKSTLTTTGFKQQFVATALSGFAMERTETARFGGGQSLNVKQLQQGIDSLGAEVAQRTDVSYAPLLNDAIFRNDPTFMIDSLRDSTTHVKPMLVLDSVGSFDLAQRQQLWRQAVAVAENSRSMLNWDEELLKGALSNLYSYQISWHEKVALPFSIVIFFLIGAALGAITKRGGLGMPLVVSVLFFVLYYVISIFGRKAASEGTLSAFGGMWMSSFILAPIAVFLMYKATNDSNLFNPEWYIYRWRALRRLISKIGS